MKENLYETDFYSWSLQQAKLLKEGRMKELDMENLIEEVEDMGKGRRNALKSQLIRLLQHLLKWQYQPTHQGSSWESTIINARNEINILIDENPGLKNELDTHFEKAWEYAIKSAIRETKLSKDIFPKNNPWTFEQIIDDDFWPEN